MTGLISTTGVPSIASSGPDAETAAVDSAYGHPVQTDRIRTAAAAQDTVLD
jgi:hypothetical protein